MNVWRLRIEDALGNTVGDLTFDKDRDALKVTHRQDGTFLIETVRAPESVWQISARTGDPWLSPAAGEE